MLEEHDDFSISKRESLSAINLHGFLLLTIPI